MRIAPLFLLGLIIASCATIQESHSETPAGPLASLVWMAGRWVGESDGVRMEEYWTDPIGSVMVGLHRDVPPGGRVFFEYLRIVSREDGVFYIAQPKGGPPTEFKLVNQEPQRAVFENPTHDDPQRIVYRLDADGRLRAEVHGKLDGTGGRSAWSWERSDCP